MALIAPGVASALQPDEILLVCNPRVAASPELAALYARTREVPLKNIVELELPDGEQMPMDRFDPDVVMPLRKAITDRGLRDKIKCIVTFYGVPQRLGPRTARPEESRELEMLNEDLQALQKQMTVVVTGLEALVMRHDKEFRPRPATDITEMLRRAELALGRAQQLINERVEGADKRELQSAVMNTIAQLSGPAGLVRHTQPGMLAALTTRPATGPVTEPQQLWDKLGAAVDEANKQLPVLAIQRHSPVARQRLRELTAEHFGMIDTLRLTAMQVDYLTPDGTNAFDSELAMLWVDNYNRKGFTGNPLHYRSKERRRTPVLMVSRLDGPESGTAYQIMLASKTVEAKGLTGRIAIDARGLEPKTADGKPDGFGVFDQRLRDLIDLVRRSTSMPMIIDDTPEVFRPEVKHRDIAVYVGWYSVRNYVPALQFVPGSVGYHVASYEMSSLRTPTEKGWVRGLLNDGIGATLGPVDEPYLQTFPDPLDFFSLLLTGQYTLAEVYWLTTPAVSWRMALIGDPLYTPFKVNPQLKVEDLPGELREFARPKPEMQYQLPGMPMM